MWKIEEHVKYRGTCENTRSGPDPRWSGNECVDDLAESVRTAGSPHCGPGGADRRRTDLTDRGRIEGGGCRTRRIAVRKGFPLHHPPLRTDVLVSEGQVYGVIRVEIVPWDPLIVVRVVALPFDQVLRASIPSPRHQENVWQVHRDLLTSISAI